MNDQITKRGRPSTGNAMSATERQRASRAARLQQRADGYPAAQLSVLLSPEANQALRMLAFNRDTSQKEIIEGLLIQAYEKQKA